VECAQGVDDTLDVDASQRPAAQGDVEVFALNIQRCNVVYREPRSASLLSRQGRAGLGDTVRIRVERVDVSGNVGCEEGESTLTATDVEHPLPFEPYEGRDRARLHARRVASVH
jgi:hypothetical protein